MNHRGISVAMAAADAAGAAGASAGGGGAAADAPLQSRTESLVLVEGLASRLMDSLTNGVVLAGLALWLGADSAALGVLAALPFFAQVAQLPAVALLLRVPDRRAIAVTATFASRLVLLYVAILLALDRLRLPGLLAFSAVLAALAVVSTAAWNAWMRDAIDPTRLGRFFGFRQQAATIVGGLGLLAAGWLLDAPFAARPSLGYALLFGTATAAGLASVWLLWHTPQPPLLPAPPGRRRSALHQMRDALAKRGHGWMATALALASCSLAVALPFSSVYLLRGLGYSFLAVTGFALASQVAYVAGLSIWGRLSDQFGNRPTLQVAAALLAACLVGWAVGLPRGPALAAALLVLHVGSGFATGGLELLTANLLLKSAPAGNAAPHMAAFGLARAAVAGAATLLAGFLWQGLGNGVLATASVAGFPLALRGFNVLALVAAAFALLTLLALGRVPEPASARAPQVARILRREVFSLSSVAGLRAYAHAASYLVESMRGPGRPRRTGEGQARAAPPAPSPTSKYQDP